MSDDTQHTRWSAEGSRKIVYRIVAKGTLILKTPAHFGNGDKLAIKLKNGEPANVLELYKDPQDNSPLLPGASIAGGLRHYLTQRTLGYRTADTDKISVMKTLFGEALDEDKQTGNQSRLIIYDAYGTDGRVITRDGVKINGKTRTASDGALYQIEMWDVGTKFPLCLELILYEEDTDKKDAYKQAFATLLKALQDGEIPMGARKNRGYGQCVVDNWAVYEYDLAKIDCFLLWVNGKDSTPTPDFLGLADEYTDKRQLVVLSATFELRDSLMIRAPIIKINDKEVTPHLTNAFNQSLLTGTSIAGALRARAEKILNTIGKPINLVQEMFGDDGKDENNQKVRDIKSSRLIVKEAIIQNGNMDYIQNRVKIDRFTGGAYASALINEQPVFANNDTLVTIELELRIPEDAEIGLLLLLLKDLWTEDLPLGGESSIGRGRLKGKCATITIEGTPPYQLTDINGSVIANGEQRTKLETYITALNNYHKGANND